MEEVLLDKITFSVNQHSTSPVNTLQSKKKPTSVVSVSKNSGKIPDRSDYRFISLLPIFGKALEALINVELVKHLALYSLFSNKQYGFCLSRSTANGLTVITEKMAKKHL